MLRKRVKYAVEKMLTSDALARVGRRRVSRRGLVLAYHNVVPGALAPLGDASLHLPAETFARQLDYLVETARVVPLGQILDSGDGEEGGPDDIRPRVAITFDDGYRGALTFGLRELMLRGLSATFFVAPGLLGDRTLWWDGLAGTNGNGPGHLRNHALDTLGGKSHLIMRWAVNRGLGFRGMPPECRTVTETELEELDDLEGITLAAHSWHHASLTRVPPSELEGELRGPLSWLRCHFSSVSAWLAYPYGHSSPAVRQAARRSGYQGSFTIHGGWLPRHPHSSFDLPRLNVPAGLSPRGFQARLAGYLCRA